MKKRKWGALILLLVVSITALGIVACGGDGNGGGNLRFWKGTLPK